MLILEQDRKDIIIFEIITKLVSILWYLNNRIINKELVKIIVLKINSKIKNKFNKLLLKMKYFNNKWMKNRTIMIEKLNIKPKMIQKELKIQMKIKL